MTTDGSSNMGLMNPLQDADMAETQVCNPAPSFQTGELR